MFRFIPAKLLLISLLSGFTSSAAISQVILKKDSLSGKSDFAPVITGTLKTRAEYDLSGSITRFEVRNARLGARGMINNYFYYKAEVDLSDEGKIRTLDAYIRFSPAPVLDLFLGQRKLPVSSEYMRNPAENFFSNKSFLSDYINNGMKDIGFFAELKPHTSIPFSCIFGVFNGSGSNNPQWVSKPSLSGRFVAGPFRGFRIAGNLYYGDRLEKQNLEMFGGEIRYSAASFFIESEYISRQWTDTLRFHDDGMYIHSYYNFALKDKMIRMITPAVRYDMMGSRVFGGKTEVSRITFGLNFGFEPKQFVTEIRFNYENYLKKNMPVYSDRLILEFVAWF